MLTEPLLNLTAIAAHIYQCWIRTAFTVLKSCVCGNEPRTSCPYMTCCPLIHTLFQGIVWVFFIWNVEVDSCTSTQTKTKAWNTLGSVQKYISSEITIHILQTHQLTARHYRQIWIQMYIVWSNMLRLISTWRKSQFRICEVRSQETVK